MSRGAGRIGILGGSFDPVHLGHLIVAEIFRHELRLDRVVFLPAGRPPHKPDQHLASAADRLTMLERSIEGTPAFEISRIDLDRQGASFTVDSLHIFQRAYPSETTLYFLMGQDSLRDFPAWREPNQIARIAKLGVARRPNVVVDLDAVVDQVPELRGRVEIVTVPLIGISSSDVRDRVRRGTAYRYQVMPSVAEYIAEKGLYQERAAKQAMDDTRHDRSSLTPCRTDG